MSARDDEPAISQRQQRALEGFELAVSGLEAALRWRSRWRWVPIGPLVRVGAELAVQRKLPRVTRALWSLRFTSQIVVPFVFTSGPATRALQRELTRHPARTLAALRRMELLARTTRAVHRGDWGLPLRGARLEALTLDGSGTGLLERASLARASLREVRFFGSLDGSDFDDARLEDTTFIGCYLSRSSFRRATLQDVTMASTRAPRCSFAGARLAHCTFTDVDLERCSLGAARLRDVVFERCDLAGIETGDATWEDVDVVDCRNVDPRLAALDGVNVVDGSASAARGAMRRAAVGATPRSMARAGDAPADSAAVTVRYAHGSTATRPPLGYRLQTLARDVNLWIALGSSYRELREQYLAQVDAPGYEDALPGNRPLAVLQTLLGTAWFGSDMSIAELPYRVLVDALRERHPELADVAFPQLVVVDGDYPVANYVDLGDERWIVVSNGLEVLTTRLARYCIAWVLPPAISYMDRWPQERSFLALRAALTQGLREFAQASGDISQLGRVQVSGMRDMQALQLGMTFCCFVLGHELAHFLQSIGLLPTGGTPFESETQADVAAAQLLGQDAELDGDATMIEVLRSLTEEEVRAGTQSASFTLRGRGFEVRAFSDADFDPAGEQFIAGVDRFAMCDWHAAAVTAFIVALGGSAGYHGVNDTMARVETVIRAAFGDRVAGEVANELAREGSALHMLNTVFGARAVTT